MAWFEITNPIVLHVSGRDAPRYLNARLTNDIRSLMSGSACIGAALSPVGRIEGFFLVIATTGATPQDRSFLVVADGGEKGEIISAFKRYIVADRVDVVDKSDSYHLFHTSHPSSCSISGEIPPPNSNKVGSILEGGFIVARTRMTSPGYDLLVPHTVSLSFNEPALSSGVRFSERAKAYAPEFPSELGKDVLFSEAPLRHAVSFTKGCYTGQEVVEKIDARGKAPRKMATISFQGRVDLSEGDTLSSASASSVGEILSSQYDESSDHTFAFAVLKNRAETPLTEIFKGEARGAIVPAPERLQS